METSYFSPSDHGPRSCSDVPIKEEPMEDNGTERPLDMSSRQTHESFPPANPGLRRYTTVLGRGGAATNQFYTTIAYNLSQPRQIFNSHLHQYQQQQQLKQDHIHLHNQQPETHDVLTSELPHVSVSPSRELPLVSPSRMIPSSPDDIIHQPDKVQNSIPDILSNSNCGPDYSNVAMIRLTSHQRAKREFVPDNRKDDNYWNKRIKNNDSARRSRVKRKALEKVMETRLLELQKENIELRHEMAVLKSRFGIGSESGNSSPARRDSDAALSSSSPKSVSPSSIPIIIKQDQDEELEQQSAGSDDSRSHDDYRSYHHIGSSSILNHALGLSSRDRTDSMGSNSSSSAGRGASFSSRPNSRSSQSHPHQFCVVDKSGALDLTGSAGELSNRSTPARDSSPDSFGPEGKRQLGVTSDTPSNSPDVGKNEMRGFPLKCRWKRGLQTKIVAGEETESS